MSFSVRLLFSWRKLFLVLACLRHILSEANCNSDQNWKTYVTSRCNQVCVVIPARFIRMQPISRCRKHMVLNSDLPSQSTSSNSGETLAMTLPQLTHLLLCHWAGPKRSASALQTAHPRKRSTASSPFLTIYYRKSVSISFPRNVGFEG